MLTNSIWIIKAGSSPGIEYTIHRKIYVNNNYCECVNCESALDPLVEPLHICSCIADSI